MTDALALRQRLAPGNADAARNLVAVELGGRNEDRTRGEEGTAALVRADGVYTASLFLDRTDDGSPGLVWYFEVADAGVPPWDEPVTTLVEHSPLLEAGLGDLLETPDSARVFSDASTAADVLVHAWLPERPKAVGRRTDATPAFLSSDDATGKTGGKMPDVVLFRLEVEPGLGVGFVRALAGVTTRLRDDGWIERRFDEWTEPVLREEGMWTETVFLERTDGDYYLLWYMEAEDVDEVYEAYFESSNPVARASDPVIGRILEDPGRALGNPVEASNFELLAHAASPERP